MPKLPAAWRSLNREKQRQTGAAARVRRLARAKAPLAPPESAKIAGLRYVDDRRMAGIRRIGSTLRARQRLDRADDDAGSAREGQRRDGPIRVPRKEPHPPRGRLARSAPRKNRQGVPRPARLRALSVRR